MKTVPSSTAKIADAPFAAGLPPGLILFLSWLIPGLGFLLCARKARAATQFVMVTATFGLGLALHGGVAWPSWNPSSDGFNLINNFTFIIQMGAGLPALASLVSHACDPAFAVMPPGAPTIWSILGGIPYHAYYELGGYYMIVAGGLNYFAICNVYDRLIRPTDRYQPQERGEEAAPAKS
ncbi:MAG: hypothetical protein M1457_00740 [bacterium]|nr:hypothetical protein [bacterium]